MKIATRPTPKIEAIQAKFAATRRELGEALIERDDEIDLVLDRPDRPRAPAAGRPARLRQVAPARLRPLAGCTGRSSRSC